MTARKQRPLPGDAIKPGMSERDIASTGIVSRRMLQTMKAVASIPEGEFERHAKRSTTQLVNLARGRAGSSPKKRRCCPHCGGGL